MTTEGKKEAIYIVWVAHGEKPPKGINQLKKGSHKVIDKTLSKSYSEDACKCLSIGGPNDGDYIIIKT